MSSYGAESPAYSGYNADSNNNNNGYGYSPASTAASPQPTLRHRTVQESNNHSYDGTSPHHGSNGKTRSKSTVVKKLDFMFPKVDTEYTLQTESGGIAFIVAIAIIIILSLAETASWVSTNNSTREQVQVDASLGQRMRVNMNITFPALACQDLHVDVMDVAGDAQIDIVDTLKKRQLTLSGNIMTKEDHEAALNKHRQEQLKRDEILKTDIPENYCGPCYGAHETEGQCCNTCDELLEAYHKKNWHVAVVQMFSEQCIREGRDRRSEPELMLHGEGCQVYGYMTLNRVAGNFHIAMGEGVERDGRHIHSFNPDDAPNFNASHIIHHLSFGPSVAGKSGNNNIDETATASETAALNGVTKIITTEHGTTGLFQYFIKIVPTTYIGQGQKKGTTGSIQTNRYYFTERFRPLLEDYISDDDHEKPHYVEDANENDDGTNDIVRAHVATAGHHKADHHHVKNSVLPGVFFMYEIYPFQVEISKVQVPFTHLLIRLMATVGGVFTIMKWVDGLLFEQQKRRRKSGSSRR